MIKKKLFKFASVFMCAAIMACSLAACGTDTSMNVQEATQTEQSASRDTESTIENAIYSQLLGTSGTAKTSTLSKNDSKEETVFVFADANGKQDHLIINEKLKNVTKKSTINDITTLKDILNLTGDETSTAGSGNALTWEADGNSITYQGTSSESAPITMKVTYFLDGKEISAKELAGKSGKVRIRFDYTNNAKKTITVNGKQQEAYVPFTMITGMVLAADKFTNVEVTNGKIEEGSDSNVVLGITMPGLKESLNSLSVSGEKLDLDIPDYFEVSADVKDFELDMTMSVAMSDLLADIDTDALDLSDIKADIQTLTDAGNQLADGSGTLADGTAKLAENVPALTDGVAKLDAGASALADGAVALSAGAQDLQSGVKAYTDGVAAAAAGGAQLEDGTAQVSAGLSALSDKVESDVVPGVNALADGSAQVSAGIDKLSATLNSSFAQIKSNADVYGAGYTQTLQQAESLQTLANAQIAAAGNATLNQMLAQVSAAAGNVDLQIVPKDDLSGNLTKEENVSALLTKYMTAYTAAVKVQDANPAALTMINTVIKTASQGSIESLDKVYAQEIGLLLSAVSKGGVYTALSQVYDTAMNTVDPQTNMNLTQSMAALSSGAKQVADGANALKAGIGTFEVQDLTSGRQTICSALYQLKLGSAALADGTKTLNSGLAQLKAKNTELNNGAAALTDGAAALADGAVQLKEGTAALNSASGTLGEGVTALNEGAITLRDGMIEFNETGVQKLAGLIGTDADMAVETVKQIVQLGKDYQSFAGKPENMQGSVKFIYKTEGITK